MPGEKGVHTIMVCTPYASNGELVCAHSQVYETGKIEGITVSPQFIAVEVLYDILCHAFILVHPVSRKYLVSS